MIELLQASGLLPSLLGRYIQRNGVPVLLISLPSTQSLPVSGMLSPFPPPRAYASTASPLMSDDDSFRPPDSPEYVRFDVAAVTPWPISWPITSIEPRLLKKEPSPMNMQRHVSL